MSKMLNAMGIGFDPNVCKPNLKMAMQRLQVQHQLSARVHV